MRTQRGRLAAAAVLVAACGLVTGPGEGVEIVVEAAHFRAPEPVRFEIRNHGRVEALTVACGGIPRVFVMQRRGPGWETVYNTCPSGGGSFLTVGPREVVRGSIDNSFLPGLYVLRFEFSVPEDRIAPRRTRSKGFQITH